MNPGRFFFGRYVEEDLLEIRDYIARNSPDAAHRLMVRFVRTFRLLAKHPRLGVKREGLLGSDIRFWPVDQYLIIYKADRVPIEIIAVVHGARDVPALLDRRAK